MIISVLQDKGGAGKTTITINVARALVRNFNKSVLVVDSDPQGSARDWHTNSGGDLLDVIGIDRPTIDKDIHKFSRDYDITIIDGGRSLSAVTMKSIVCSDLVLIPVMPSPYDLWATKDLVDLVKQRQDITDGRLKAAFIVSRQIVNTNVGKEVRSVLVDYGLSVLEHGTFQRVAYVETAAKGSTVVDAENLGIASLEINWLAHEILEFSNNVNT